MTTAHTEATESTLCLSCQYEAKRAAGVDLTNQERNHWMMWGCTCTPESSAEALWFMDTVTR